MKKTVFQTILVLCITGIANCVFISTSLAQTSPCENSILYLANKYGDNNDPTFRQLVTDMFANLQPQPDGTPNPWQGKGISDLLDFVRNEWCEFLPTANPDNGLEKNHKFRWLFYNNPYGFKFVTEDPGLTFTRMFNIERGAFMDSAASTGEIQEWINDPRTEIQNYVRESASEYTSWNDFFTRNFKPGARPISEPNLDYVITAPSDCLMSSITEDLTDTTPIPAKDGQELNVNQLLANSPYAANYVNGGKALNCTLLSTTYHHFHAPVGGSVVESKIIEDPYWGIKDAPTFAMDVYTGTPTDWSSFEYFKRGYFIIKTANYGTVAMIPIGLSTISSVVFDSPFDNVVPSAPQRVTKGDKLGEFQYGGSLVILLFEPGQLSTGAIKVRLGNQIGVFSEPQT